MNRSPFAVFSRAVASSAALLTALGWLLCSAEVSATEEHHFALRAAAYAMVRDIREPFEAPPDEALCTNDVCLVCHVAEPPAASNFGTPFLLLQLMAVGGWQYSAANSLDQAEQVALMLDAMETLASDKNSDYYDPDTEVVDFDGDGVDDFLEIITGFSPNPGDDSNFCDRLPLEYGCGAIIASPPPSGVGHPWSAGAAAGAVGLGLAWSLWRRRRAQRQA